MKCVSHKFVLIICISYFENWNELYVCIDPLFFMFWKLKWSVFHIYLHWSFVFILFWKLNWSVFHFFLYLYCIDHLHFLFWKLKWIVCLHWSFAFHILKTGMKCVFYICIDHVFFSGCDSKLLHLKNCIFFSLKECRYLLHIFLWFSPLNIIFLNCLIPEISFSSNVLFLKSFMPNIFYF